MDIVRTVKMPSSLPLRGHRASVLFGKDLNVYHTQVTFDAPEKKSFENYTYRQCYEPIGGVVIRMYRSSAADATLGRPERRAFDVLPVI